MDFQTALLHMDTIESAQNAGENSQGFFSLNGSIRNDDRTFVHDRDGLAGSSEQLVGSDIGHAIVVIGGLTLAGDAEGVFHKSDGEPEGFVGAEGHSHGVMLQLSELM